MQENVKQVTVKMTARRAFRTEPIYQYDVGHELVFEGFDLPAAFEVHYSLSPMGNSITQIGQDGVCTLPDMYTRTAAPIYAWLYIAETDTGLTKYEIEIPVARRAKPTDQQPTPVQQSAIDQAIAALNDGVEAAEEAQRKAEEAAESVRNASATATTLEPGSDATVVVEDVNGVKTFKFGIPEGEQGEKGDTGATPDIDVGTVTTLPAGSAATVTITGTDENPVLNFGIPQGAQGGKGDPGDPTELIDDTAGEGDVTKVWSADKSATEVSNLNSAINKSTPIASHFYFKGKEPFIDTQNRTITFYAYSPFVVHGKPYGNSKNTNTVVNIPTMPQSSRYYILYLDLSESSTTTLSFCIQDYSQTVGENWAYVGQINIQSMIFAFPFNVNIDGTLNYALGEDVYPLLDAFMIDCDYQTYSGGYIRADNGDVGSNSSTGYTSYIDVSAFSEIQNPVDHRATYQMAFYDKNKVYVSGATINQAAPFVWSIPVPNNAKYARLSFYLDVENTFYAKGFLKDIKKYIESIQSDRDTKLKGKKLGIIGDSISTYQGYIPSGYVTFYPRNTVTDVENTWWKQLLNETGMELCVNASWSGSTISGDTSITSGYVGCSDARVNALTDGQGNKPDIIIVWMGINDFGKTNGITCGSYDGTTAVSTATNITAITEAYGVLLKKLENNYPNAQIFVCRILPEQFASEMSASYANGFPNINPDDNMSLPELNDHIEQIANAFGCGVIPMDKCGITFFNVNTYTGDGLHPNALLTPKMCEVAKETLLRLVN